MTNAARPIGRAALYFARVERGHATTNRSALIVSIGVLGFASGLPNVLVNDTLSAWLSDLGFKPSDIGLLSLLTLPYGLKLLWAPLLDHAPAPGFSALGLRRSWIALFCVLLVAAFAALAWVGPSAADSPVLPAAIAGLCIAALSASLEIGRAHV